MASTRASETVEKSTVRRRESSRGVSTAISVELAFVFIEPRMREYRSELAVDAITVAVRSGGSERLLVCTADDTVREVSGSLSLGLVSNGPTRLSGAAGLVQAVESSCLFGFTPVGYCGARFRRRPDGIIGGVAAWTRRPRRWTPENRALLRKLALVCGAELDVAEVPLI